MHIVRTRIAVQSIAILQAVTRPQLARRLATQHSTAQQPACIYVIVLYCSSKPASQPTNHYYTTVTAMDMEPVVVVETETRHRKELKALEGERRAAVKKLKATLGKKAKDAVTA